MSRHRPEGAPPSAWPERLAGLLGLLFLAGALAVLVRQGLTQSDAPPDIVVRAGAIAPLPSGGGFRVGIHAFNQGGRTAATVQVRGELRDGERLLESSVLEFDYIPDHSSREGGLFFRRDPRGLVLDLRATGYADP